MIKWFKRMDKKHKDWYMNNKYYFSKPLVWGFFIVAVLLLVVVGLVDGFDEKVFVSCPEFGSPCVNPLVNLEGCDHYCCSIDFLPAGSSCGEKVSWLGLNYSWIVILLFVVVLVINHFVYNRGYDFNKYWGKYK